MLDGFELPYGIGDPLRREAGRVAGADSRHHVAEVVLAGERDIGGR